MYETIVCRAKAELLQPLTGNGDVSVQAEYARVGSETTDKIDQ